MSKLTRHGTAEPSSETEFSGASGDKEFFIFPVQLTTSRTGNLTRVDRYSAICEDILYCIRPIQQRPSSKSYSTAHNTNNTCRLSGFKSYQVL